MLITELRDAYREANKSFEMSIQLEGMKDEVKIFVSSQDKSEGKENANFYLFSSRTQVDMMIEHFKSTDKHFISFRFSIGLIPTRMG